MNTPAPGHGTRGGFVIGCINLSMAETEWRILFQLRFHAGSYRGIFLPAYGPSPSRQMPVGRRRNNTMRLGDLLHSHLRVLQQGLGLPYIFLIKLNLIARGVVNRDSAALLSLGHR